MVITSSSGADRVNEQLVSNLLPVTELPTVVQTAKTSLRRKSDIQSYTKERSTEVPPFILREGRIFTFSDLHDEDNPLQQAIEIKTLHGSMMTIGDAGLSRC